jgi:hypothetical protein
MEETNGSGNASGVERRKFFSRRALKYWSVLFLMVAAVAGTYKLWNYFQYRGQYQALENYNAIVEMMKNDTHGGATPEETLRLFVAALKEGDVEKASLYFALDESGSREKWLTALRKDEKAGNLPGIIEFFSRAQLVDNANNRATFKVLNDDGSVGLLIQIFNNGKVWKIESI